MWSEGNKAPFHSILHFGCLFAAKFRVISTFQCSHFKQKDLNIKIHLQRQRNPCSLPRQGPRVIKKCSFHTEANSWWMVRLLYALNSESYGHFIENMSWKFQFQTLLEISTFSDIQQIRHFYNLDTRIVMWLCLLSPTTFPENFSVIHQAVSEIL